MKKITTATILVTTLVFSGCSKQEQPPNLPTNTTTPAQPSESESENYPQFSENGRHVPTFDLENTDLVEAQRFALEAFQAFIRQDLDEKKWLENLTPYLTTRGHTAYQGVDPTTIGEIKIEKVSTPEKETSGLVRVPVQTNIGSFEIQTIKTNNAWKIDRIVFPTL